MADDVFVDTSGFYALLVKGDDRHFAAQKILNGASRLRHGFVTTDYVLDETATLLKARGFFHLLTPLFARLDESRAFRIEWTGSERFRETRAYFLKHSDQAFSFTDCLSFILMKELKLSKAITKDSQFQQAGFLPLLK